MADRTVGGLIINLEARTAQIQQDMAQAKRVVGDAMSSIQRDSHRAAVALEEVSDSATVLTKMSIGAAVVAGLALAADRAADFTQEIITAQREAAKLERTLVMANGGNLVGVARDMAFLDKTAADLGVRLKLLGNEYGNFVAVASRTALAGKTARDVFEGFATAASAKELTMEEFHGALIAVTQMMSKGRVSSEELYGQLAERLPEAAAMAASAMGMTTQQFRKALENGEVLASDLLPRLAWMLKNEMGDAAKAASEGLTGSMNDAATSVDRLYKKIAQSGAGDALASTFRGVTTVVDGVTEHLDPLVTSLQAIGTVAAAALAGKAAGALREYMAAQSGASSEVALAARHELTAAAALEQKARSANLVVEANKKAVISEAERAQATLVAARQELSAAAAANERLGLQAALAGGNVRQLEAYRQQAAAQALVAETDATLLRSKQALTAAEAVREAQLIKTPETLRAVQVAQQAVVVAEQESVVAKGLLTEAEAKLAAARSSASALAGASAEAEARLSAAKVAETEASTALGVAEARLVALRETGVVTAAEYQVATQRLTAAKLAEAEATSLAGMATRAGASVMAMLGGPIGLAVTALTILAFNWDKVADRSVHAADMAENSADRIKKALEKSNFAAAAADVEQARSRLLLAEDGLRKAIASRDSPANTPQLRDYYQKQVEEWGAIADDLRGVINRGTADILKAKDAQAKAAMASPNGASVEDGKLYALGGTGRNGGKPEDTGALEADLSQWRKSNKTKDELRAEELTKQKEFLDKKLIGEQEYLKNVALINEKYAKQKSGGRSAQYGSVEDQELARLKSQIENEKLLAVELAKHGAETDKLTPGQNLLNRLAQEQAVAVTAAAQAHIGRKKALAEELVTLEKSNREQQKMVASAKELAAAMDEFQRQQTDEAAQIVQQYETPFEREQREHAANRLQINNNTKLTDDQRQQALGREDQFHKSSVDQMQYGVRSDLGLVPDEDRVVQAHAEMQRRITGAWAEGSAERARLEIANQRKLAEDQRLLELQRGAMVVSSASSIADSLMAITEAVGGKQSKAYKAMFLAQKALAIAEIMISTEVAAAKVKEQTGIFGIGMDALIRAQGYASVAAVTATTVAGMAHDGIDNIPREGTWLLDKGERVVDSRTNADLKRYLQQANRGGSAPVKVTIINNNGGQVSQQERVGADGGREIIVLIEKVADSVYSRRQAADLRPGGVLNGS